jgi:hypothetical protein
VGTFDRWLLRLAAGALLVFLLGLGAWHAAGWYIWRAQVTAILNAATQAPPALMPPAPARK